MRVLVLVTTLATNQVARAQSLTAAAEFARHEVKVRATAPGEIWLPLLGTEFAEKCAVASFAALRHLTGGWADAVLSVKALPGSLGVAARLLSDRGDGLLADIDDPDLEAKTIWASPRALATGLAREPLAYARYYRLSRLARRVPTIVSNPVLQGRYGGAIIPHARPDFGPGEPHTSGAPVVAFIGSPWRHKGLHILRAAVQRLAKQGWRLVVTAPAPSDAQPWEHWLGAVPARDAMSVLKGADVVALPSLPDGYGRGQLPMKMIDAMLAGRAVAASNVGPLPWALDDGGLVFEPTVDALTTALLRYSDPAVRTEYGTRARKIALARYIPEAVAPALDAALRSVAW